VRPVNAKAGGVGATVTLRDVARLANVHPGTVSRALNAETRALVNDDTAQRVIKAAEDLGYRPNPIARGLKTNRSYTVGVLIPDLTNPLFPPIVRGIEDRLDEAGYTPLIANTDNDPERERVDFQAMRARQVDGFITATARQDHELLDEITASGQPIVLVNRRVMDGTLPAASVDDREGSRLAVEHVASLGHRRIAYLAGSQRLSTGLYRYEGFRDAMRAAGLEPDERLVRFSNAFTEAEGARLSRELLDSGADFTAIIAANDLMALGCYDALAERGIDCPAGMSVVGFNDMRFADRFRPPLTTVSLPHREIGKAAGELLLEVLQDPATPPRQILLAPSMVVRSSTAPPAA
jgi:LacI family transcriptional regulator